MNQEEILDYVKKHPSQKVKIAFTDIDGVLRGKYISSEKFLSVVKSGAGFCDVIFGWDMGDVSYDNVKYTGWHTGYPDAPTRVDLSTFRKIPWENEVPFFLGDLTDHTDNAAYVCPRQLAKKIIRQADEAGFKAYFSQEFEWFNFRETPDERDDEKLSCRSAVLPATRASHVCANRQQL